MLSGRQHGDEEAVKKGKKGKKLAPARGSLVSARGSVRARISPATRDFEEVAGLIEAARIRAFAAVNHELVNLYWQIGE